VLTSEDLSVDHPSVSCSLVVQGRGVGLARHVYASVVRYLLELI
jgi:hypothetical protein